jgi:hypothetical protein
MIDETPIIYQRAKYCVYTTIIKIKLTTLLANECILHQYIMCVYSCTTSWNVPVLKHGWDASSAQTPWSFV